MKENKEHKNYSCCHFLDSVDLNLQVICNLNWRWEQRRKKVSCVTTFARVFLASRELFIPNSFGSVLYTGNRVVARDSGQLGSDFFRIPISVGTQLCMRDNDVSGIWSNFVVMVFEVAGYYRAAGFSWMTSSDSFRRGVPRFIYDQDWARIRWASFRRDRISQLVKSETIIKI